MRALKDLLNYFRRGKLPAPKIPKKPVWTAPVPKRIDKNRYPAPDDQIDVFASFFWGLERGGYDIYDTTGGFVYRPGFATYVFFQVDVSKHLGGMIMIDSYDHVKVQHFGTGMQFVDPDGVWYECGRSYPATTDGIKTMFKDLKKLSMVSPEKLLGVLKQLEWDPEDMQVKHG